MPEHERACRKEEQGLQKSFLSKQSPFPCLCWACQRERKGRAALWALFRSSVAEGSCDPLPVPWTIPQPRAAQQPHFCGCGDWMSYLRVFSASSAFCLLVSEMTSMDICSACSHLPLMLALKGRSLSQSVICSSFGLCSAWWRHLSCHRKIFFTLAFPLSSKNVEICLQVGFSVAWGIKKIYS